MTTMGKTMGATIGTGRKFALLLIGTLALTACEDGKMSGFFDSVKPKASGDGASAPAATSAKLVERDVEAPDVFQVTDKGLWDGRPSLGGVWVAHSAVSDPERVIIRNTKNGKFVIGALFKREATSPGPEIQVSSDAAGALGLLAGSPVELNVTALRREEVASEAPAPQVDMLDAPEDIAATPLDPIADAAAALDALDAPAVTPNAPVAAPAPKPKPATAPKPTSALDKPFIQIGIFSVQANANRTREMLASQGLVGTIKTGESAGKSFWRVVVGPATTAAERKTLLANVKKAGFTDAYAVTH
ncbi:SPOR domain-containing protein [Celeribacter sp.]|uniref:SPOR domain-containing protein n=1 Tax=Celeribacter sp. TaxID=1890673 RepID=UPI003A8D590F